MSPFSARLSFAAAVHFLSSRDAVEHHDYADGGGAYHVPRDPVVSRAERRRQPDHQHQRAHDDAKPANINDRVPVAFLFRRVLRTVLELLHHQITRTSFFSFSANFFATSPGAPS